MRDRPHCEAMVELYRADPDYVFELLNDVKSSGNVAELRILLSQIEKAFGDDALSLILERHYYIRL